MSGHAFMDDQRPIVVCTCQREVAKLFGGRRGPTGAGILQSRGTGEVVHFSPAVHRIEISGNGLYGVMGEVRWHIENVSINQEFSDCEFVSCLLLDFRLQRWREF